MRKPGRIVLFLLFFIIAFTSIAQKSAAKWGASAITLGPAIQKPPVLNTHLTDWKNALSIDNFYRLVGENIPVTPTQAKIAWDDQALYVAWHCHEPNMKYPIITQKSFSILGNNPFLALPDAVVLYLRSNWDKEEAFYMFTLDRSGTSRGEFLPSFPLKIQKAKDIKGYKTAVIQNLDNWIASITIPWPLIGGKPAGTFGLNVLRARGMATEFTSPVALDFKGFTAPDLFMEATFGKKPEVQLCGKALSGAASGIQRWQKPAVLTYPDAGERKQIWQLQQELKNHTTYKNLANRLHLANCWWSLMTVEGYSFRTESGCGWESEGPSEVRATINKALRAGEIETACKQLDDYMASLDKASRNWFADESPANERATEWMQLLGLDKIEPKSDFVELQGNAGKTPVKLILSFPTTGGMHLRADKPGFFKPGKQLAFHTESLPDGLEFSTSEIFVKIEKKPFKLIVSDKAGKKRWILAPGDLAFRMDKAGQIIATDLRNKLLKNEAFFGFGEQFANVNHRGNVVALWGMAANESIMFGLRNHAYKPVSFFHSTRGYSMFLNTSYRVRADVGFSNPETCRLTSQGPVLDFFLWPDDPLKAIESYTSITGKPILPPKWAFEPWIGGQHRRWQFYDSLGRSDTEQMLEVINRYKKLDIPHSALYAEGGGNRNPALYKALNAKPIRIFAWMNSTLDAEAQQKLLPRVPKQELPILHVANGELFPYVDFSHPNAFNLIADFWKARLDLGLAGSMVDFGDMVPEDAVFYDKLRGDEMHNQYAYHYHKTFHDVFKQQRGEDFVLFTRSGTAGSQRWSCQFAGDHPSNFWGLTNSIHGGLNLSASGFSTWGSDAGGHAGWTDLETYARWIAFACFSPLMRYHCNTPREPWDIGEAAIPIYKKFSWIRENLQDYIYSAALEASKSGRPMMKVLSLAFPREADADMVQDEYLFGNDLLVAPVHAPGNKREIIFPPGQWIHLWSGEAVKGATKQLINVPLNEIPVYLRSGALVPVHLNADLQWGASMTDNKVAALVLTKPTEKAIAQCWESADSVATFTIMPTTAGFSLQMEGRADTRYILIYGTAVSSIEVNGKSLPKLAGREIKTSPLGWYHEGKRVVVRLPHNIRRIIYIKEGD